MKGQGGAERGREQTPDQLAWASSSRQGVTWSGGDLPGQATALTLPGWELGQATSLFCLWLCWVTVSLMIKRAEETRFLRRSLGEMKCPKCSFLDKAAPWGGVWGSSKEKA